MDSDTAGSTSLPTDWSVDQPRGRWPEEFRQLVELFEEVYADTEFDEMPGYPDYDDPYVCHVKRHATLPHTEDDTEYNWHLLWNPWPSPADRTVWKFDGSPLLPEETAHGAPDDEDDPLIATDDDLIRLPAGRAVVCIALTKVGEWHSRGGQWRYDHGFDEQLPSVIRRVRRSMQS